MSVDSASVVLALERSSAAMTTPQRWMILPTATYSVIVVAAVVVSGCCCCCCRCWCRGYGCCAVAGFLGSLVRRCRSGRPGWLGNPRCPNGSPAGVLLLRFLLSMLAAVRGHDNATTVDDTAHLKCYCCCCCLLLLASWLGSLVRRCRSGRSGWLGNPRCPDGSPAGVLLLQ